MNHKIKRKWCAALRGGTWTQIKNYFREEGNKRCALGVLFEAAELRESEPWLCGNLEKATRLNFCQMGEISIMNDRGGKTFSEIADWIEENVSDDDLPL